MDFNGDQWFEGSKSVSM